MDYNTENIALNAGNIPLDFLSMGLGGIIGFLTGLLILFFVIASMKSKKSVLEEKNSSFNDNVKKKEEEIRLLNEKLQKANENVVRSQTENTSFQKQLDDQRKTFIEMEEKFKMQFENLANKIFDEKSKTFKSQSQESLNTLLSPLRDKLTDFQKKVDDSFGKQANEQSSLKEHIRMIVETHEKHQIQTENLTNALKGDSKKQGDWGEIMMEKILEDAGLRKDIDYIIQGTGLGIKHIETGGVLKPDAIVNLPEGKHIIIDSKVSLTHYERYCNDESDDGEETKKHLSQFIRSVRTHVKDLEKRRYQDTHQLGTPDFVLMFMPVEGAYMLALQKDTDLHQFAWDKGVVLVGPSTLFSTLRTVSSLWRLVNQNNNALEIAKQGGALYEKVAGFVDDMKKIGVNLKTLEKTYDGAMNKLSDGRGNILKRTEDMKALGIKTSKSLPADLIGEDLIEDSNKKDEAA